MFNGKIGVILILAVLCHLTIALQIEHDSKDIDNDGVNCTFKQGWCGWKQSSPESSGWYLVHGNQNDGEKGSYIAFNASRYESGYVADVRANISLINSKKYWCMKFYVKSIPTETYTSLQPNLLEFQELDEKWKMVNTYFLNYGRDDWVLTSIKLSKLARAVSTKSVAE
ncbi:Uncharacterised protein g1797 [Pycnogonum litorale]